MKVKLPITGAPLLYSTTSLQTGRTGAFGSILLRDYYRTQFGIPLDITSDYINLSQVTSNSYNSYSLRKMSSTVWQYSVPGSLGVIKEFYNDTGTTVSVGACGYNIIYSSLQIDCNLTAQAANDYAAFEPGNVYFLSSFIPFPQRPDYKQYRTILTLTPTIITGTGRSKIGSNTFQEPSPPA